jgi:hypothetical protein
MAVAGGATVILSECDFIDNNLALGNETSSTFWTQEAPTVQSQYTITHLHNCSFSGNTFDVELVHIETPVEHRNEAAFVTSDPYDAKLRVYQYVKEEDGDSTVSLSPSTKTINGLTVPAARRYINATSTWFLEVQEVRFACDLSLEASSEVAVMHSCMKSVEN